MRHARWCILPIAAMLPGCASNPDQSVYVMPAPTSLAAGSPIATGALVIQLRQIILPDYLDTSDLMTRTGQYGIEASRTGRWGERLSKGVTRALAADLGQRLPAEIVADGPDYTPSARLEVTVSAFDVTRATSVLAANWSVKWPGDRRPPMTGQGSFSTSVAPPGGDLAVVAAMAETVAELSDGIAATARADAEANAHLAPRQ
jgi:uncharacterized lipoprotein YmbA